MEYPKINSLYKRERHKTNCKNRLLIEGEYACPEFPSINCWSLTEKVDGTNIRISMKKTSSGLITFGGRTDNAQVPTTLLNYLQAVFPYLKMKEAFPEAENVILFGEGYGGSIQSGQYYSEDPMFILF